MKLIHEKTFPMFGSMDVTDEDVLLVRVLEGTKHLIQVIHRLTGDLINEIPSMCDHTPNRISKYPKSNDYAFESCETCKEIYAHNVNTGESLPVHKGYEIVRTCDGPGGSLLVLKQGAGLHKLEWNKTQEEA